MLPVPAFAFVGFFLAVPVTAQREVAPPLLAPGATPGKVVSDVSAMYDQMEANLENQYAKLINDAKARKSALEDQIRAIDKQIAKLEADRQKSLADLRKQKEKAIKEASKAQDVRLVRTPTPAPKRP
ncbi:MAG TPA: hypothetical protein VGM13_12915 [Thermoanaerobaculia bacterium]